MSNNLPADIQAYYNQGREENRLISGDNQLERVRTQEIIKRYAPEPPAVAVDIGGGAGVYALWLSRLSYEVHLVDLIPLHIEQALQASANQPAHPLTSAHTGDARTLDFEDNFAEVALLLGPLYHLTERTDRLKSLREAYRILKPGGWLFAATISRFAALLDALRFGRLTDPYFVEIVERGLQDGQHRNPRQQQGYFTTAYFHHPTEGQNELAEAGFQVQATLAIEGPGRLLKDFDEARADSNQREHLLHFIRMVEQEPALMGVSGHMMYVGRK